MAEKQVVPQDIHDEAYRLYPPSGQSIGNVNREKRIAWIAGAINERAKGGMWTNSDMLDFAREYGCSGPFWIKLKLEEYKKSKNK